MNREVPTILAVVIIIAATVGLVLLTTSDGCRDQMRRGCCADAVNPQECMCVLGDHDACK